LAEVEKSLWPKFKNNKNFKFIVIGREHTDQELTTYNEKKGFTFPLYPDPERKAYAQFAEKTIPRAYIFGKDGKLIHASTGYKPGDVEKLIKIIDEALAPSK
jgi:peroxiredoxin